MHNLIYEDSKLSMLNDTYENTDEGYRVVKFVLDIKPTDQGETKQIHITTIFFDFIFYDINKNLIEIVDETVENFNDYYKEKTKKPLKIFLEPLDNVIVLNGAKCLDKLEYDYGKKEPILHIIAAFLEKSIHNYEYKINTYNRDFSKFYYIQSTIYQIQCWRVDPRMAYYNQYALGISFCKKVNNKKVFETMRRLSSHQTPIIVEVKHTWDID